MECQVKKLRNSHSLDLEDFGKGYDKNDCSLTIANRHAAADDTGTEPEVWRTIAMHQFYARRRAEQQNTRLRDALEAQIRLSQQLKALLQSQQAQSVSEGCSCHR
ncbi:unnamed protein product [Phytophthora fragariaefolia]|uniref:Unnamed protein product n=1 Tax=Phytophthora fragariaefolia TaxID=1490495 RepID=A0A9W6XJ23_9STRA|nr:unnamed protein product [Phytophthora fragariaefolia]